jgi:hypothetical protein
LVKKRISRELKVATTFTFTINALNTEKAETILQGGLTYKDAKNVAFDGTGTSIRGDSVATTSKDT